MRVSVRVVMIRAVEVGEENVVPLADIPIAQVEIHPENIQLAARQLALAAQRELREQLAGSSSSGGTG